ncbi:MAG: serine--tRNA ligase [Saprospiraceae bacterium]|nr:serine--tRNA ligase [Saprospiraceae bacterium]
MLEIQRLREQSEQVKEGLKIRNYSDDQLGLVDRAIEADALRRKSQTQLDGLLSQVNSKSKDIGRLFKEGKQEEANQMRAEVGSMKQSIKSLEEQLRTAKEQLEELLLSIPNVPHPSVPPGNSEEDNEVFKAWSGDLPDLGPDALPHWELAEKYRVFDLKLGVKITGAGFPVFRSNGAKLQRALINFFLDEAAKAGYEEIVPPLMVNEATARATGQLPDKEGQMYHVTEDNLYLIPTAEVPVTNIHREDILDLSSLPIKLTGYTPCFRREAGSYGADVKGLNRVHQFDKIEIVQMTHPDRSYDTLDEMLDHVEGLLKKLELPYRILRLCGGDLTFASALTYDFEVYSAAQKKWLEVSSVSNFETFQSNRMKLRYRKEDGKTALAHTLNGSALALARIIAAIMENYQTSDGIVVPDVLRKYAGCDILN